MAEGSAGSPLKYAPLGAFLRDQSADELTLPLTQIETLVGPLPSGGATSQFWSNAGRHHQTRRGQWLEAGFQAFFLPAGPSVRFVRNQEEPGKRGADWTVDELEACVAAYHELWLAEQSGRLLNKAQLRQRVLVAALPSRSPGAYEFRMQNISAVLDELGLSFVIGYLPRRNVGRQKPLLIRSINVHWDRGDLDETPTADPADLTTRVSSAFARLQNRNAPPPGSPIPRSIAGTTVVFCRDPNVIAWTLISASGHCEACTQAAPFTRSDGTPYLEVHHVRPLSEGGPDTCDNAVALCPNCHRRLHYAADRKAFRRFVITKIPRLADYPERAN